MTGMSSFFLRRMYRSTGDDHRQDYIMKDAVIR